jgi:hypothetical protein
VSKLRGLRHLVSLLCYCCCYYSASLRQHMELLQFVIVYVGLQLPVCLRNSKLTRYNVADSRLDLTVEHFD